MKLLLAPLQKLANLIEEQNEKLDALGVLTLDLREAAVYRDTELATQTEILTDIKSLLLRGLKQEEVKEKERKSGGFKMKMPTMKGIANIGLAVVSMAAAIVVAGALFMFMPILNPLKLLSALAVAGILYLMAPVFIKITEALSTLNGVDGNGVMNPMDPVSMFKNIGGVLASIVGMSLALVVSGAVLLLMPIVHPFKLISAALVAGVLYLAAPTYVKVVKALSKLKGGKGKGVAGTDMKSLLQSSGLALLSMVGMALALVLSGFIFMMMPRLDVAAMLGAIAVAAVLYVMSYPYVKILKALRKGKVGIKELGLAALALPMIAMSVVISAWIFQLLPTTFVAPPWKWTLEAGLAMAIFAIPFILMAKFGGKLKIAAMLKATIAAPLIAISILAVAWIFQILPSNFIAPPQDWSLGAGMGIMIFAIPFMIIGALATAITPFGLLMGALGIILIAGSMFVVAWIFSGLPDLSAIAKNFTDAIMYPINAMVDVLVRIKEEIGVDNLLPLAGGLFAIAGGWLALVAALAGQAAGGLFSSVANLGSSIIDGIGSLFGGKKTKTPIELLDMLIGRTDGIIKLADPIRVIGQEFVKVAANTNAVIKGMGAVLQLADNSDELTEAGKAMTEIGAAYKTIADSSKIMNVEAIQASARMFEAIAKVAENQGEDAISVLARELMVAVRELSETVANMEEVMEDQQKNMKDVISGALSTFKDKIFGAKKKADDGTEADAVDMSDVVAAIQDLETRFDRPIPVDAGTGF